MLSPTEERCVLQILKARVRLLADADVREELGISPVMIDTAADMAQDILDAAGLGHYADDGREHVYILDHWVSDVRHYGGWDPLAGCPDGVLSAMDDSALAAYLQQLVSDPSPSHTWGIPRRPNAGVAKLKRRCLR